MSSLVGVKRNGITVWRWSSVVGERSPVAAGEPNAHQENDDQMRGRVQPSAAGQSVCRMGESHRTRILQAGKQFSVSLPHKSPSNYNVS